MSGVTSQAPPPFFDRLDSLASEDFTGVLRIALPGRGVVLHLKAGAIVRAEQAGRGASIEIVDLVVRRGLISIPKLNRLLDAHLGSEPGRILRDAGVLDSAALAELRTLQVERVFERLLATVPDEVVADRTARVVPQAGLDPLPLSELVSKLRRRAEEWPLLIERLGAREVALRPVTSDPGTLDRLGPDERRLLDLVGDAATVGELLERTPWCDFVTLRGVWLLAERGVLGLVGGPEPPADGSGLSNEQRLVVQRSRRGHQITTFVLVLAAAALLVVALGRWAGGGASPVDVRWARLQQGLARRTQARLRATIEVHRLRQERLPADLGVLVGGRYLAEGDPRHPGLRSPFFYRREGEAAYSLLPPYR